MLVKRVCSVRAHFYRRCSLVGSQKLPNWPLNGANMVEPTARMSEEGTHQNQSTKPTENHSNKKIHLFVRNLASQQSQSFTSINLNLFSNVIM